MCIFLKNITTTRQEERLVKKYETENFVNNFSELLRYANDETVMDVIKFMTRTIQGEIFFECMKSCVNQSHHVWQVPHSLLLDMEVRGQIKKYEKMRNISQTPIISCTWNYTRVIENINQVGKCNHNPFNGEKHKWNIHSYLMEPLGVVLVYTGNHSVNAAMVHNEGEIFVEDVIDISPNLEKYQFDGINYIEQQTGKKIKDMQLKNESEPFTYTLGLLFEAARLIQKRKMSM